jgi:P27 family predicted phage terminase small subunit
MPGPSPLPTAILALRGSWRAKTRRGEPTLPVEKPTCPVFLSTEAKSEWRRQVVELSRLGVLAKIDRALLAVYCEAWGEFVMVVEAIGKSGVIIKDRDGRLKRNPLCRVRDAAVERMIRLAGQFGFTPAARTRLRAVEDQHTPSTKAARFFRPGG